MKRKNTKTTKKRKNLKTVITRSGHLRVPFPCTLTAACLLLFLTISVPLSGRDKPKPKPPQYALIFGTVWGPDDLPAYGIQVNIRRADQRKAKWHVYSNRRGEFGVR